jgi:hypothetical protein
MAETITRDDVLNFIYMTMTDADRGPIIKALNEARKESVATAIHQFRVGQFVEFTGKWGDKIIGEITKINRVTIFVKVDGSRGMTWRVSPNLLKPAQK